MKMLYRKQYLKQAHLLREKCLFIVKKFGFFLIRTVKCIVKDYRTESTHIYSKFSVFFLTHCIPLLKVNRLSERTCVGEDEPKSCRISNTITKNAIETRFPKITLDPLHTKNRTSMQVGFETWNPLLRLVIRTSSRNNSLINQIEVSFKLRPYSS